MISLARGAIRTENNTQIVDKVLPNCAAEEALKIHLTHLLRDQVKRLNLTQAKAASIIGMDQSDLSKLVRGRTEGIALARLLAFVRALGGDVEIKITAGPALGEGQLRFCAALDAA